ncbi:putative non-specific serine/threonine protein kinase [Microsporum ferrugineum]
MARGRPEAEASQQTKELEILLHLSRSEAQHAGKMNILEPLDYFEHHGPNGTHLCLIFPVMLCDGESRSLGLAHRKCWLRAVSYQIILGLEYIHASGLIHCVNLAKDLQPANIMFMDPYARISLSEPEFSPVEWLEGVVVDNSAPKYLLPSQRIHTALDQTDVSATVVKIGDFGGGNSISIFIRAHMKREDIIVNYWQQHGDTLFMDNGLLLLEQCVHQKSSSENVGMLELIYGVWVVW